MNQYSGKIIRKNPVVPTQQSASGVWTVEDAAVATQTNTWPVSGVPYPVSRSLRLRSSASAYLNRTPSTAGNRRLFTINCWVKRGALGSAQDILSATGGASTVMWFRFNSSDQLDYVEYNGAAFTANAQSTAVFRDPSAWYCITLAFDSAQVTAANRLKIYVNNVLQTMSGTLPTLLLDSYVNGTGAHFISREARSAIEFIDGYVSEYTFVDGQALTPSSFGTTDSNTGAWIPMAYSGTYGTNGFYLNFKDNTSTTTLGYDYSGNANNWTANNISLTAGVTYDSMLDVPTPWVGYNTDGGASVTRGNYATLNPLDYSASGTITLTNGNLTTSGSGAAQGFYRGTMSCDFKTYYEVFCTSVGSAGTWIGFATASATTAGTGTIYYNAADGKIYLNGSITASYATFTTNDVIGLTYNPSTGSATFYKNNTLQGSVSTGFTNPVFAIVGDNSSLTVTLDVNFGQRPFSYTPPTGFKSLCTTNLPEPTIKLGAQYMAASTYTGNGGSLAVSNGTNNTTSTTFQPDFVWIKNRVGAYNHYLYDALRGANNVLESNTTAADSTQVNGLNAFTSTGFTLNGNRLNVNESGSAIVGWQWKAAGSSVSNTSGTITSTVNAGTTQGFSVVTYTGTGANATVGHGLGVAPKMIIVKRRDSATNGDWFVYTATTGNTSTLYLNLTNAVATGQVAWNSTTPTSTVFSIGNTTGVNASASTYVAYCFAEVAGYSKFGSYTGNGSADGPFVYCGFRPRWIMVKSSTEVTSWWMYDSSRDTYNAATNLLRADLSNVDTTQGYPDFLSNGWKVRNTGQNTSGQTYIYAAFAENPFKYSNAR